MALLDSLPWLLLLLVPGSIVWALVLWSEWITRN